MSCQDKFTVTRDEGFNMPTIIDLNIILFFLALLYTPFFLSFWALYGILVAFTAKIRRFWWVFQGLSVVSAIGFWSYASKTLQAWAAGS